jgi:tRNA threonylcarbamoyl adenosine modification protein YeaZ
MNVLAFDTCLGAVSVAVRWQSAPGAWQMRHAFERRRTGHAERLMPMIEAVMDGAGLGFSDLHRVAVTVGPGSFTGVRVGVAAARGLALASGLPVVAATSLAVMAHAADQQLGAARNGRLLLVAVEAHRGMVYVQPFGPGGDEPGRPLLVAPEAVAALLGAQPAIVVGSGAEGVAAAIAAAGGAAQARLADLEPDARALALLAGALAPSSPLLPLYLRSPDVRPQADKSLPRAGP